MHQVKPDILVFADPLFHYGCSIYAAEFRHSVEEALIENENLMVISTSKFYRSLYDEFYDFRERIITIPLEGAEVINTDLNANFKVAGTSNVFTLLMLPIAASLSDEIHIIGVDGKPINLDSEFWKYSKTSQNNDSYDSLRRVHPGFFDLDYTDFYLHHCDIVSQYVNRLEYAGKKISSLERSYIPALRRRSFSEKRLQLELDDLVKQQDSDTVLISLNPDLSAPTQGHFYVYDNTLRQIALLQNCGYLSLTGKDADLHELPAEFIPFFSYNSWVLSRPKDIYTKVIKTELEQIRNVICQHPSKKFHMYMYMGSIKHVLLLEEVFKDSDNAHVTVNLFGAHNYLAELVKNKSVIQSSKVRCSLESDLLITELKQNQNLSLDYWPMMKSEVLDCDDAQKIVWKSDEDKTHYILFACTSQLEKGYDVALDATALILKSAKDLNVKFRIRKSAHIKSNPALLKKLSDLKKTCGSSLEIIEGDLSNHDYNELYKTSDILVIPYREKAFMYKTSGAILDGIDYAMPVVATKTTWAGRLLDQYGVGETFEDGSAASLEKAVLRILHNYDLAKKTVIKLRDEVNQRFHPTNMVSFLTKDSLILK